MYSPKIKKRYKIKLPEDYLYILRMIKSSYKKVIFKQTLEAYSEKQMRAAEKILFKGLAYISNNKKYANKENEIITYLQEIDYAGDIISYCYNEVDKKVKRGNSFIRGLYNCFYNSLKNNN